MKHTMLLQRGYFLVVSGFTLWVGAFGFFWPQEILRALPWPMPTLHARFVGALYLAATLFLLLSARARRRLQTRTIVDIAFVWTGWLLLITLLHRHRFDIARVPVWYWLGAYLAFPLGALWLRRAGPVLQVAPEDRIEEAWVLHWLRALGVALVVLAAVLFLWPASAEHFWPWKIAPFLAQLYSGPVLAFGVGNLLLAARRNWPETLIPVLGLGSFALLALLGSCWHLALFTPGSASMALWFGSLALLAVMSSLLAVAALCHGCMAQHQPAVTRSDP